jgi:flagellin-specific chaperone FliS
VKQRTKTRCWDKIDEITKIFFESHTRLRRELQLKLVDARVALEHGDIEKAKRIIHELLVFLDM